MINQTFRIAGKRKEDILTVRELLEILRSLPVHLQNLPVRVAGDGMTYDAKYVSADGNEVMIENKFSDSCPIG